MAVASRVTMRSMRPRSGHFVAAMLLVACGGGAAATQLPKAPPQAPPEVGASPEAGPPAEAAAAVEAAPPPVTTESCTADAAWLAGGTFKTASEGKTVTVQPFCLDRTEVTADAYAACVRAGQCTADHLTEAPLQIHEARYCNYGARGRGKHPINCVDWNESATYCRAQGKRLPTQEEWEWAARGGSEGRPFPWGNQPPRLGCTILESGAATCPAGSNSQDVAPGGIHDLAGNVSEWTQSAYGSDRIHRGGDWGVTNPAILALTIAEGDHAAPEHRDGLVGFRCAR